jgi:hypothetical protein
MTLYNHIPRFSVLATREYVKHTVSVHADGPVCFKEKAVSYSSTPIVWSTVTPRCKQLLKSLSKEAPGLPPAALYMSRPPQKERQWPKWLLPSITQGIFQSQAFECSLAFYKRRKRKDKMQVVWTLPAWIRNGCDLHTHFLVSEVQTTKHRPHYQLHAGKEQHKALLYHFLKSLDYSPHHPLGSGWHHLWLSHSVVV